MGEQMIKVMREVDERICLCDRCERKIPATNGYASGIPFQYSTVVVSEYDVNGKVTMPKGLHVHDSAKLCKPCIADLARWIYGEYRGTA